MESLDAEIAGGADPGGVLEQLLGALRDSLLASVGCDARVLRQPKSMGVDLAALGRSLGTETVLAMLQVIDQAALSNAIKWSCFGACGNDRCAISKA